MNEPNEQRETSGSVAILLATYNGEKYLAEMIDSLIGQTYTNFIIYVRDDGSTDKTQNIIKSYEQRISIIQVAGRARLGPAASFIELLRSAAPNHNVYMFADQDDVWLPEKISEAVQFITAIADENTPKLFMSAYSMYISESGNITPAKITRELSPRNALCETAAPGCSMAINSKARLALIDAPPPPSTMHDRWAYFVISNIGICVAGTKSQLLYRIHSNNAVGAPTGGFSRLRRRISNYMFRRRGGAHSIAEIAEAWLNCPLRTDGKYPNSMLEMIAQGKSSLMPRLTAAFLAPLYRKSFIDTVLIRFLLAANKL
jgi:glycosyltransferase involved in cell wall biosynthesis